MTTARKDQGITELPNGRFLAQLQTGGQRRSKSFDTRKAAVAWRAAEIDAADRGPRPTYRKTPRTVVEVYEALIASRADAATRRKDEKCWSANIRATFARRPFAHVTTIDVEEWLNGLRSRGLAEVTIATNRTTLSAIFTYAIRRGWLSGPNPVHGIAREHAPRPGETEWRVLTGDEVTRMLRLAPDAQTYAMLVLMHETGLRISEVAALRKMDVEPRRIRVRQRLQSAVGGTIKSGLKNGNPWRDAPLTARAADALAPILDRRDPADLLFVGERNGRRLNLDWWTAKVWHPIVKAAKLPGVQPTPHDLRHTFLTNAASWCTVAELATLAGHNDLKSLMRYVHAAEGFLDRFVETADARAAKSKRGHLRAI